MNFRDGLPIYQQIADRLMDEILPESTFPTNASPVFANIAYFCK